MKVCDLFEKLEKEMPNIRTSKKEMIKAHYPLSNKWEKLGNPGSQAAAYLHPGKNMVVKAVNISGPSDPFYQFVRLARKHQDNPYFPKIGSVNLYPLTDPYRGKGPKPKYSHKMVITTEKLYHLGRALYPMIKKLFDIEIENRDEENEVASQLKYRYFGSRSWRQELMRSTKDSDLKQALRLLEPLFQHYHSDLHTGNMMLRRTGQHPQIVFNDPVV